jgi:putative protein-disulfide isomerase
MEAQNPSDNSTLIAIAKTIGLNEEQFAEDLNAVETQQQLESEIMMGRKLGVQGFPSMMFVKDGQAQYLPLDYNSADKVISIIKDAV